MGIKIPEVLISGHHAKIEEWKHNEALKNTYYKRPDMLKKLELATKTLAEQGIKGRGFNRGNGNIEALNVAEIFKTQFGLTFGGNEN